MQIRKLGRYALIASIAAPAMALSMNAQAELSGNVGVVSKYMFRGIEESGGPAVQGGLDYAHESGFYAGWWASSLGYADEDTSGDLLQSNSTAVENDFYIGFAGEAGDFSYDLSVLQYYYIDADDADATELTAGIGWGPLSLSVTYNATDVTWSNSGDIYVALGYETALPYAFDFGATLGYYNYDDDDAGNSKANLGTTESGNMQHLDLTLSRAIGDTPATMSVTYMLGGKDRTGADIDDTLILGLTYEFDI